MNSAPNQEYHNPDQQSILISFDLREPGAAEALHRARNFNAEASDIEALDEDHFVLVVRYFLQEAGGGSS